MAVQWRRDPVDGATSRLSPVARYRLGIAARIGAAIFGGYGVAAALSVALARWLPLAAAEAVITATLAGLIAMPVAALWAFGARSAGRAWAVLAALSAALALAAWAAGPRG